MDAVFSYFVAIGAGLTTGIALVALPTTWLMMWMIKRQRRTKGDAR